MASKPSLIQNISYLYVYFFLNISSYKESFSIIDQFDYNSFYEENKSVRIIITVNGENKLQFLHVYIQLREDISFNDSYRVEKIYHIYSFNVSNFKVHSVVIEVRMKKKSVTVFNFILKKIYIKNITSAIFLQFREFVKF